MCEDRTAIRQAAKMEILRRGYVALNQGGRVYSRDVAEAVGIPYDEFCRHVFDEMNRQGLIDNSRGEMGSPRGFTLPLSAAGMEEAERLGAADPEQVAEQWRARLAVLQHLAHVREQHGAMGLTNLGVVVEGGIAGDALDAAVEFLYHKGLIEHHQVAGFFVINEYGLDALERLDRQSALSAKLSEIEALSPQRRGKALEGVLADALRAQGCRCEEDQGGKGEQIDLVAESGLGFFVCECKWEKKPIQGGVVDQMVSRMGRRPAFFVGVIFSMSGFTPNAYEIATRALGNRTVLLVGEKETRGIIQGERSFEEIAAEQLRQIAARGRLEPANT